MFQEKRNKKIYLSDEDIKTLEKYDINYTNFSNMKELLFEIETVLNTCYTNDDLDELSIKLSEYNYYFDANK